MANDDQFIREVDEEYRRDQIARIWKRYSGLIVAVAILVVGGVGGWRYWQHVEAERAQASGTRFQEAVQFAQTGKTDEAEKVLSALVAEAPAGYQMLARFRLAAEEGTRDPEAGARLYDLLAVDAGAQGSLRDLARLRGALLRLGTTEAARALSDLEALANPTNPFRHSAREFLGLAALKRGEFETAGRWFDQITVDTDTPAGLRSRLEVYSALVAGGPVQTTQ